MVRKLLLPLDGSRASEAALPCARMLHRAFGSRVVLLRVVEIGHDHGLRFSGSLEWRFREAEARDYLATVRKRLLEWGIEAETLVASGTPAREIVQAVSRLEADVVVMTATGEGGGGVCGLGGTTHQVISAAETSILLVRQPPRREGAAAAETRFDRVVVPVDGSSRGDWALSLAASFAGANGTALELLHVVPRPVPVGHIEQPDTVTDRWVALQRQNGEMELEERCRRLAALSAPVRAEVVVATSVSRAIATAAAEGPESLLVLSAHGQSGVSGWPYGSTVSSLLAHGRTSTLVFQDLPRRGTHAARATSTAAFQRPTVSRPHV